MKNYRFICLLFTLILLLASGSILKADQDFEFYYQTVVGIAENTSGAYIQADYTSIGRQKWSSSDNSLVYTVNRIKVNSRDELIEAIGVPESRMNTEEKAILASYDYAKSEAMKERAQYAYKEEPIKILYTDTSTTDWSYKDKNGNTKTVSEGQHEKDFWSWSSGYTNTISISTEAMVKGASSDYTKEAVKSTLLHEYSHSIDKPDLTNEGANCYGADGTHYTNEITMPGAAMIEGWAEYNEMMEFSDQREILKSDMSPLTRELTTDEALKLGLDPSKEVSSPYDIQKKGEWTRAIVGDSVYVYVDPKDLTAEELWKCESYNANALYEIATTIPNGKQKIYDAFLATRDTPNRNIRDFISELCEQNPSDIAKIGRILNNLTYGKMTDREFEAFIGTSNEAKSYLEKRASGKDNIWGDITSGIASETHNIASKTRDIRSRIASKTRDIGSRIASGTRIIGSRIASTTKRIGTGIASITKNIGSRIASTTKKIGAGTASATKSIGNTVGEAIDSIGNAISNFIEKVKEVFNEIKEVVKNTVNKVVDFFKNLFNKESNNETVKEENGNGENTEENNTTSTTEVDGEGNTETESIEVDNVETDSKDTSKLSGTSDEEGDIFNIR